MKKEFKTIFEILGNDYDIEVYESVDKNIVHKYYCDNIGDIDNAIIVLLLAKKRNSYGDKRFIKYPNIPYFIELPKQGGLSAHGNMISTDFINIWEESNYKKRIRVKYHDSHMIMDWSNYSDFFFLEKNNNISIDELSSMTCLVPPNDVVNIEYCYHLDTTTSYLISYYPSYEMVGYDNKIFKLVDLQTKVITNLEYKNFCRYRDGGTTTCELFDSRGNGYEFYSPTPFKKNEKASITQTLPTKLMHCDLNKIEKDNIKYSELINLLNLKIETTLKDFYEWENEKKDLFYSIMTKK